MKTLLVLAFAACSSVVFAQQEIADLLTEAQRNYLRGERAAAKEKFALVQRMEPGNRIAVSYLKRIAAEDAKEAAERGPANATQEALQEVILPKVQFVDSSLADALDFLRQKGNQAGNGKVAINFVMQLDENTKNRKVTLALEKVPFTEVLRYIGELAGVQFSYERFAISVKTKPNAATPAVAAPPVEMRPKIEGL